MKILKLIKLPVSMGFAWHVRYVISFVIYLFVTYDRYLFDVSAAVVAGAVAVGMAGFSYMLLGDT